MADEICEAKMTEESVSEAKVSSYFDALQSIPFSYYTNDHRSRNKSKGKRKRLSKEEEKNASKLWDFF